MAGQVLDLVVPALLERGGAVQVDAPVAGGGSQQQQQWQNHRTGLSSLMGHHDCIDQSYLYDLVCF